MKRKSRRVRFGMVLVSALLIIAIGGSLGAYLSSGSGGSVLSEVGDVLSLSRPAFAQNADAAFLDEEAGAAAYMNAGQTLDLSKAWDCYKVPEKKTDTYTIGSIWIPGLPETEDIHCYVHVDGWIVCYYLKAEPLSKIVAWEHYVEGELDFTKLDAGLNAMRGCLQAPMANIKYYDFEFPEANNWMIVIKSQFGAGTSSLNILTPDEMMIPNEFSIHERSWSHYCRGTSGSYTQRSDFRIDATLINNITVSGSELTEYGELTYNNLPPGTFHEVSVSGSGSYGTFHSAHVAICLVYFEPEP